MKIKSLPIIVMLLSVANSSYSQDIIFLKNDSTIHSKVISIEESKIEYKKADFLDGPTYSIDKKNVISISYKNGKEDVFDTKAEKNKKMYIWKPKKEEYPAITTTKSFSLDVIDNRRMPTKKKWIKYTGIELIEGLKTTIQDAAVNSTISDTSDVKIRVIIEAYDATFYPGWWHAKTRYSVRISDTLTGLDRQKSIEKMNGFYNIAGSATAKNRLSKSYFEATTELIEFINEVLK